jgi:tRNA (Thr-GGU) A37 N-methylase
MAAPIALEPIGTVDSPIQEALDDVWGGVAARITLDGTPVLDIKPYFTEFAPRHAARQPAWSRELMAGYWQSGGSGGAS